MVNAALRSGGEVNDALHAALKTVDQLASRDRLLGLISTIRDDPVTVRRCAAMSHRHPLGHDKIMLIDTDPAFRLRLHAWWPDRSRSIEHVHHHRFNFATTLVRGEYEMQIFQRSAAGIQMIEMIEYRQSSSPDEKEWYLHSAGTTQLRLLTTTRVAEGAGYTLSADALHRVLVPHDKLCITLFLAVITDVDLSQETRVFGLPESPAPTLTMSTALTPDDYRRRLDAIAAELTGSS